MGILQADAYAGFGKLYEPGANGQPRILEAACWAHLRRDFHDVWKATGSPIAFEALERIGKLYDIETAINGEPLDRRHAARQKDSRPHVEAFRAWCEHQLTRIPGKGDLAKAMRYALNRWESFALFLDDARVAIDNNAAERAIRPISLGRKNFLFAGSDAGGEILANAMTIIETAKLAGLNPETYLANLLARIPQYDQARLDDCSRGTGSIPAGPPPRPRDEACQAAAYLHRGGNSGRSSTLQQRRRLNSRHAGRKGCRDVR